MADMRAFIESHLELQENNVRGLPQKLCYVNLTHLDVGLLSTARPQDLAGLTMDLITEIMVVNPSY